MKYSFALPLVILIALCADCDAWWGITRYSKQYLHGVRDMYDAYREMRKANVIGADKYFHAKGNYNAARRGPGGAKAAEHMSNLREFTDKGRYKLDNWFGGISDKTYERNAADSDKDMEANEWGRSGGDPNKYRVRGIPDDYRR